MSQLARAALLALSVALPALAESAAKSPSLERAARIEAGVKLCKLFSAITKSSPKFDQIAFRIMALYDDVAVELKMPVPEAIKAAESRAQFLVEEIQKNGQVSAFCQTMKKEED